MREIPQNHTVVGLGEVLWDCFADTRRPGGAPSNVAYHAGQLGHRGVICSRVGDDELGRELIAYLQSRGMDTSFIQVDKQHETGKVTVDAAVPDRPSFVIHEDAAWDHLEYNESLGRLMNEASAVCFGTLAQRSSATRATIQRCLAEAHHAWIVYDVNLRQDWFEKQWIEDSLRACHVVKLNGDEVTVLADYLGLGSADPRKFAHAVREGYDVQMVCITRGDQGCMLFNEEKSVVVSGRQVKVADTVGAGDSFTAALISGLLRKWSMLMTASLANQVGAMVAGRHGAMPDIADKLTALIKQVQGQAPRASAGLHQ